MAELVRLRGLARAGAADRDLADGFHLEDASGRRMRIEVAAGTEFLPGDAELNDGDFVAVEAVPIEHAFDETQAGPRAAPERRLAVAQAVFVGIGTNGDALIDAAHEARTAKKAKKDAGTATDGALPPRPLTSTYVLALAAIASAVGASAVRLGPLTIDLACASLLAAGTAAFRAWSARACWFVTSASEIEKHRGAVVGMGTMVAVMGATLGGIVLCLDAIAWPERNASALFVGTVVCVNGFIAVFVVALASQKHASRLRSLLRAPPFARGELKGEWGGVEGVVRDPTPVTIDGRVHALALVTNVYERPGSDPPTVDEKQRSNATFFVDVKGRSFEIDPRAVCWASTVRFATKRSEDHVLAIPVGANALVAGHASRKNGAVRGFLTQRRDAPVLVFATPAGTSARSAVRRLLLERTTAIAVLIACAVAAGALAYALEPRLPPSNIPLGDAD
jgi:hypothetical protein